MTYLPALAQIGVPPPVTRECTVEELDQLLAYIDHVNEQNEG